MGHNRTYKGTWTHQNKLLYSPWQFCASGWVVKPIYTKIGLGNGTSFRRWEHEFIAAPYRGRIKCSIKHWKSPREFKHFPILDTLWEMYLKGIKRAGAAPSFYGIPGIQASIKKASSNFTSYPWVKFICLCLCLSSVFFFFIWEI